METIALRFSENFAPSEGTILAHNKIIETNGYVWYGKLGNKISKDIKDKMLKQKSPKILLIQSGGLNRYWATISDIAFDTPADIENIPSYYRDKADDFKTWFKVTTFEHAPKNVMSNCIVASSKKSLSEASKYSMSPYFKIIVEDTEKSHV